MMKEDQKENSQKINMVLYKLTKKETNHIWTTEEEKEYILKYIYKYMVKNNFHNDAFEKLKKRLNKSTTEVLKYIRIYIKEYITDEQLKEQTLNQIEQLKKQRNLDIYKKNEILYNLTGKVTHYLWNNEEEKELMLKYFYEYCQKNYYLTKPIIELSYKIGISHQSIQRYAEEYVTKYLNIDEEEYKKRKANLINQGLRITYRNQPSQSKIIYESIYNAKTIEEIINTIDGFEKDLKQLRTGLTDYIVVHQNKNQQMYEIIKTKLDIYTNYMIKKRKEEKEEKKEQEKKEQIPYAIELINDFIYNSEIKTINSFCQKHQIAINEFENCVEILKTERPEIYMKYQKKQDLLRNERYKKLTFELKIITSLIEKSIEENGYNRQFDLIDYYSHTNLKLEDFLKLSETINNKEKHFIIKKFYEQNIKGTKQNYNDIKMILKEKVEINHQKDEKGMPIPGTGEVFSNEKKEQIINYLKENNIPLNRKTYMIAFKRYVNGFLDLESHKIKKLKNN